MTGQCRPGGGGVCLNVPPIPCLRTPQILCWSSRMGPRSDGHDRPVLRLPTSAGCPLRTRGRIYKRRRGYVGRRASAACTRAARIGWMLRAATAMARAMPGAHEDQRIHLDLVGESTEPPLRAQPRTWSRYVDWGCNQDWGHYQYWGRYQEGSQHGYGQHQCSTPFLVIRTE